MAPRNPHMALSPASLLALSLLLLLAMEPLSLGGTARAEGGHDFRGIRWGMSRAEVLAREKNSPVTEEEKQGSKVLLFSSHLYGLKAELSYTFTRDKCWYAKYEVKSGIAANLEDMKRVYRKLEDDLMQRYGRSFAILDMEYDSILGRTWKTRDADILLYLKPVAGLNNRLELSLSFLCRDLMYEVLDINRSRAYGF